MNILLTGGLGYIASHSALPLIGAGNNVILFDNLSNSDRSTLKSLEQITNKKITFIKGDVADTQLLLRTLKENNIKSVIHFAGFKSVKESAENPLLYYDNNLGSLISLINAMQINGIKKLVFSSSATVYGHPKYLPYDEKHPTNPINPYGRTKLFIEEILRDISASDPEWSIAILRYFNPIGAHDSGLIGEAWKGSPNNLMPHIINVASGHLESLKIFGGDYDTRDGTPERDYIHIMDLAEGHLAALNFIELHKGFYTFNLGSGSPTTVLELVEAFKKINLTEVPYEIVKRRHGDLASYYSNALNAKNLLNWEAKQSIEEMCLSAWKFSKLNQQIKMKN